MVMALQTTSPKVPPRLRYLFVEIKRSLDSCLVARSNPS